MENRFPAASSITSHHTRSSNNLIGSGSGPILNQLIDLGHDFSKDLIDDEMLDKELQSHNISQLTGADDGCNSDLQPHGQGENEHEDGMCNLGVEDGHHNPLVDFSRKPGEIFLNV